MSAIVRLISSPPAHHQEENEFLQVGLVLLVDGANTMFMCSTSIDAKVLWID